MPTPTSTHLLEVQGLSAGPIQNLSFAWPAGVSWVCGDEGQGKTTLLRVLAGEILPTQGQVIVPEGQVFWVDLQGPEHDQTTVQTCWERLRAQHPQWNDDLLQDLAQELDMARHIEKQLHMLSTGSRRKVTAIAALASGATITLLDQPFAALDFASIRTLHAFLQEAAEHAHRAWLVADYEAPAGLPLASLLNLNTRHLLA